MYSIMIFIKFNRITEISVRINKKKIVKKIAIPFIN